MAIEGFIRDLNLIDLFQVLSLAQKTGILVVTGPAEEARVLFFKGTVAFAQDRKAEEHYQEVLERFGLSRGKGNGQIGERIRRVYDGLAGEEKGQTLASLRRSLTVVAEEATYRLFNWEDGRFRFEESSELADFDLRLSLELRTENLIMEGSRRIDEWSRIMTKIPSLDAVFVLTTDEGERREIDLRPEEWAILAQVDGRKRMREIIGILGGKDFEVARTLFGLAATGLVRVISEQVQVQATESRKSLEEHLDKGRHWLARGDLDRAGEEALEAVRLSPDSGPAHLLMGQVSYRRGLWERALSEFAATISKGVVEGYYHLGLCHSRRGDFASAAKDFGEFLKRSPDGEVAGRARRALTLLAEWEHLLEAG